MIKNEYTRQTEIEVVSIEQLVPQDHLLRIIEENYDFSFVRQRMEPLYSKTQGRPAIDPVMLFKMLFIGYLYGIRSERQLEKEVQVNVAYRWFLNLNLTDKVPDHSTISQNRRRRFQGTDVFRQMFDDVVQYAYEHEYIDGKTLYTDSTHMKANANNKKFTRELVQKNTQDYFDEIEQAVNEDRIAHGKKPLPSKVDSGDEPMKEIKVSTTDPDSGYMARTNKPEGFHYLDHRTCDGKHNIITDAYITPGNINDSTVYLDRLNYQINRFGFSVESVGLDSGYHNLNILKTLSEKGIYAVVSYRKPGGTKGLFRKSKFQFDAPNNQYICAQGHVLKYRTTNRNGFRSYASDPKICSVCPLLSQCTNSKKQQKVIERHVWEEYAEQVKLNLKSERGEYMKQRRSETIERSFADSKQLHGYRYARFRGIEKVESQALMTAIAQNIKKMVMIMTKRRGNPDGEGVFRHILSFFGHIQATLGHFWAHRGNYTLFSISMSNIFAAG